MVSQIPVSVPTLLHSTIVQVSPNPTTDYLRLAGVKASALFAIFDLTGREIKSGRIMEGNNLINVKEIIPGVYILKGYSPEESFAVKFIKVAE